MPLQINQKIELRILHGPDLGSYVTRVEDIGTDGTLTLALPLQSGIAVGVRVGDIVRCTYADDGNFCGFDSACLSRAGGEVPVLVLAPPQSIQRVQRRNYVRLNVNVPVRFSIVGAPDGFQYDAVLTWSGTVRDLSGGGALLASPVKLIQGARLDLTIDIPGYSVATMAEVVRTAPDTLDPTPTAYPNGVRFVDIAEKEREIIIRYIFGEQRDRRKKGLV